MTITYDDITPANGGEVTDLLPKRDAVDSELANTVADQNRSAEELWKLCKATRV